MYGGGGGTPLGGHTPGPCQASRLPPHNPRLLAPPKHGHVRRLTLQSSINELFASDTCDAKDGWEI